MDIRFCDLCNESVPEADIARGRAFIRKGNVICWNCEQAMGGDLAASHRRAPTELAIREGAHRASATAVASAGHRPARGAAIAPAPGAPGAHGASGTSGGRSGADDAVADAPPRERSWTGAAALVLALGSIAAVGVGGTLLLERLDRVEAGSQARRIALVAEMDDLRGERVQMLRPLGERLDAVASSADASVLAARTALEQRLAALESDLNAAVAREGELRSTVDAFRLRMESLRSEALSDDLERNEKMADLLNVIEYHGQSLIELRERIREAGALVAAGGVPAQVPGAGADIGAGQGWLQFVTDLEDPAERVRLDAVLALGEAKDPAVVPHVIPMLRDVDHFVRMVAAQTLGDLRAKPAAPPLIDTLEDERWPVREAARDALRNITGQNFGFDPTARDADRKKRVEQWRSWWRKAGDDFLTS